MPAKKYISEIATVTYTWEQYQIMVDIIVYAESAFREMKKKKKIITLKKILDRMEWNFKRRGILHKNWKKRGIKCPSKKKT